MNWNDHHQLAIEALKAARACDEAMARFHELTDDPKTTPEKRVAAWTECSTLKARALELRDKALAMAEIKPVIGIGRVS